MKNEDVITTWRCEDCRMEWLSEEKECPVCGGALKKNHRSKKEPMVKGLWAGI